MSALFDTSTKNLECTLGTPIDPQTSTVMIAAWVYWTTGQTHVASGNVAVLADAGTTIGRLSIVCNASAVMQAQREFSSSRNATSGGAIADATWRLCVAWTDVDDGTAQEYGILYNSDAIVVDTSGGSPGTLNDFTRIRIGQNYATNNANTRWRGQVAEVSVWTGKTKAQAATIRNNLLLYYADANFPTHQPAAYWPLLNAVTATTGGVSLTNNGTTTFDAAHPTLTSFSAGGGPVVMTACVM